MSQLAAELERLWSDSDQPPDLISWWSSGDRHKALDPTELLSALLLDQSRRWQTTQPWTVEKYLSELAPLPDGIDWRLQLASGELAARTNSANPLTAHELRSRFPDLAEKIAGSSRPDAAGAQLTELTPATNWIGLSGRYKLERVLGEGAFGIVHLAWDDQLERQVAIKISRPEKLQDGYGPEQYLREAQAAAGLDHPNIVTVFDVGRLDDGRIFVVTQFINGQSLEKMLKDGKSFDFRATAELLATVASALHHAHSTRRLIHRDVKPANILIEEQSGKPFVADFGLAIYEEQSLKGQSGAGTPQYMSPEQVREDVHRLDGRSDLFALGIILYEMLTSSRPFRGSTTAEVKQAIRDGIPATPRSLRPAIPPELERICLKALAKRICDRHCSAADFAAELQAWLQPNNTDPPPRQPVKLRPRGLRSFDEQDQDFFLDLLPGIRNRELLPENIAFWKQRIEEPNPELTFGVGLIYGPSGCGKSSLVKAGILPRLSNDVVAIYIEATPDTTEQCLVNALRRRLPVLDASATLPELFTRIGQSPGPKVVLFLDQFEQWLSASPIDDQQPLVLALRKCEGSRLQTILMVRGDYFPGVSRLMHHLEIPLVQQQNFALVDLFSVPHAELVLRKFGVAYGQLPVPPATPSQPQETFLREAAAQLAVNEQVIPVRLALFAQMVSARPWLPETLSQMGGLAGIGVAFLEETFTRDARCRQHLNAVRRLLKALLPTVSDDIKGSLKTVRELQQEAGYENRPRDFQELLRILDGELRLITPAVTESEQSNDATDTSASYQLTHDYLVPSIREWLRLNQTPAERILEDRTRRWSEKRETRQLPSFGEYLQILWRTDRARWTEPQRLMLRSATRTQAARGGLVLFLSTCLLVLAVWLRQQSDITRAETLASSVAQTKTSDLAAGLLPLQLLREYALPTLQKLYTESAETSEARLHLAIARLQLGDTAADLLP
ncbi:MAG: protein kinase domain-containing protein, partial [Planctomycetaceae bacterium]